MFGHTGFCKTLINHIFNYTKSVSNILARCYSSSGHRGVVLFSRAIELDLSGLQKESCFPERVCKIGLSMYVMVPEK